MSNLPTTKKDTIDSVEKILDDVMRNLGSKSKEYEKDTTCYRLYHGEYENKDFPYLTQIGENILPAKIRNFPMIKSKVNKLVSQDAQRDIKSRVYCSDQRSIEERDERRAEKVFNIYRKRIEAINQAQMLQIERINVAKSRLRQIIQRSPQNEQEAAELEALQAQLPLAESKLNAAIKNVNIDNIVTQKDIEKVDRYMTYEDKDIVEEAFQGGLNEAIVKQEMKRKKVLNMRNRVITGKEYYYVHWEPGMQNPVFDIIPVRNIRHSSEASKFYVQDCQAAAFDIEMGVTEVLARWGKQLKPKEIDSIVRMSNAQVYKNGFVVPTPGNGAVFTDSNYSVSNGDGVKVTMVYWKKNRDASYKMSPNKHTGEYFRHVVSNDYKPRKNETVVTKNIEDLWEGIVINDRYYVGIRKSPLQLRRFDDDPSFVQLPIIGESHNDPANKPYSLIWETRDIQELNTILHYQRELMIAMSGVKGIVMDSSQKADMSDEEWLMDFKRGIAWIESMKNGKPAQFNQFQTYDNTLSPAIGYITDIINHLEEMASDVTGVTRQSTGKTDKNDQVGTFEMAIDASNIITYIMYYDHDIVLQHALTRYVNCARHAWKDGKKGTYMTNDKARRMFKIFPDMATDKYFSLFLSDSSEENNKVNTIKQLAVQARNNREITLSNLIEIFDSNNIKEMQEKVSYFSERMAKIAQDNAMSVEQKKKEVALAGIELKAQYDMKLEMEKNKLEQAKLMLEQGKLEMQKLNMYVQAKLEREKMGADMQTKAMEVQAETAVEMAYLDEDRKANYIDQQIRKAQLQIDALQNQASILMQQDRDSKSHTENMKKLEVEKTKARSQGSGKEHIKDS